MKSGLKIIILLLAICSIMSLLVACGNSSPELYWHNDPNGIVQVTQGQTYAIPVSTNDLTRLQKVVPFTIMLPKYFPDGQNSYKFQMIFSYFILEPDLNITYDNLKNKKQIEIDERQLDDYDLSLESYPGSLETQAKLNGGTVLTLADSKIWEREDNTYVMPRFYYHWIQGDLQFNGDISGYDTNVARKIIESVIK